MEILPFSTIVIDEAGMLLAQRYQRERQTLPELPARFEDPAVAAQAVAAVLQRKHSRDVAARRHGRMTGFLIEDLIIDAIWERSAWPTGAVLTCSHLASGLVRAFGP